MSLYPSPTTGLGVAANILVAGNGGTKTTPGYNNVTLSVSGTGFATTFQLNPQLVDAAGNEVTQGTQFTLTAAANASGGTTTYTGTITGGGSNAFAGLTFVVAGFDLAANNGTFICTASTTTTLVLDNANGVSDTHAATATTQELGNVLTYLVMPAKTNTGGTYKPVNNGAEAIATVSATGLLTSVAPGNVEVEISYPTFNNTIGVTGAASGNPMHNLPAEKVYATVNVQVNP